MKKTLKTMNNWSMIFVMIAMVLIIITNTKTVNAETIEMEPNNNFQNAQEITICIFIIQEKQSILLLLRNIIQ